MVYLMHVRRDERDADEAIEGGVTLEHNGPSGAIHAVGWLDDDDNGYSNTMSFADPAAARGQTLYGVQLFLGNQPGQAGPGQPVDLRTRVVLRNMTAGSVGVAAAEYELQLLQSRASFHGMSARCG